MKYEGTAEEFWNTHKQIINGKEYLVVEDYNGRKWKMDRDAFDVHTTDKKKKRAFRTKYLPNIYEIVQNPDEVWLGRDNVNKQQKDMNLSNYNFVKYYKDSAIVVSCKIEDDTFVFKTWFLLKDKNKRKGLLLKRGI